MAGDILWGVLAAAIVLAISFLGFFQMLGAHPWWHTSVALVGAPLGGIVGILLRRGSWLGHVPALIAAVLTAAAYCIAYLGKTRFAASFAEDVFAGQMWYIGWITVAAFAALTLTLLPRR